MKNISDFLVNEDAQEELEYKAQVNKPKKISVKAKHIGKKLAFNIYGGDFNELSFSMDNNDTKSFKEYCGDINRAYNKKVFSSSDIAFMISNWNDCLTGMKLAFDEKYG